MNRRFKLELLLPAQRELEEIARIHMELAGSESARKITDHIYTALENLCVYPQLGSMLCDKRLQLEGYRMLICGKYLCVYRQLGNTIYIYHIIDGRTDYPRLFSEIEPS